MSLLVITRATATSDDGNVASNVIDNNGSTRWSALGIGQTLTLELSEIKQIQRVEITWYKGTERRAKADLYVDTTKILSFESEQSKPTTVINLDKAGKIVKIVCNGNTVNLWNSITGVNIYGTSVVVVPPIPPIPPPPPPTPTGLDFFGVKMIYPTAPNGRVFNAPLTVGSQRTLSSGQRDGTSDLKPLGNGTYTIYPSTGEMKMAGSAPRAYVFDAARTKLFENVEITCYYKSVSPTSSIARGYQGFEISCRGQHELAGSNARVYYSRHSLDGRWWRLKEDVHPTSKDVSTNSGVAFNQNVWYGMKFVVRNLANGDVEMKSYRDTTNGANGGTWQLMFTYVDKASAPWAGYPLYKSTTPNCGCHSSFVRTDNHNDFRVKKWSIRAI